MGDLQHVEDSGPTGVPVWASGQGDQEGGGAGSGGRDAGGGGSSDGSGDGSGGGNDPKSLLEAFNTLRDDEQEEILSALSQVLGRRKAPGEATPDGAKDVGAQSARGKPGADDEET
ncbi:hypothetical protein DYI23_08640 [Roseibium polysiphoniae]|uniref:Uncharacterized protein n=1 Tax=Roseibium polysiphoniae TaxID=2571221 RepID=A0A944CD51_9HYPH|nr:hypothetical protein [Roseibium polysiphoniae]MBS8260282.1 hypothetical protein [Roseibium polysiphoniae]